MPLQLSVNVRNAQLDAIETAIGATAVLRMYTGAAPASCAAASTGTQLISATLPADWMAAAASGSKALLGTWSDASADASGDAGYFRIFESTGTTCHVQGTITASGGGGDLTLASVTIAATETVTVTAFTLTAGNA